MNADRTEFQSPEEQQQAQQLSLKRAQPPAAVDGYEPLRFLGAGAYGEVWVGIDKNTGRQVAIKFFLHRSGVDCDLLSREVEKLVFLSTDRYVVQLLDVGWESEPPYYVMEYVENGSLEDALQQRGAIPATEAVSIFQELATGLMHAHGRGVLHCDLKPANVLLDQDGRPRLADFGQSRLSHEQRPALGTLFYMAPEQADLEAVPDARWDVYALGAIFYRMLTGDAPYRTSKVVKELETSDGLDERLRRYREMIQGSPRPIDYRNVSGVDRALWDIMDRCLAPDPNDRYPNVQSVLNALHARDVASQRWPLMVLGFLGPIVLLTIMVLFGWRGYEFAVEQSRDEITRLAAENNGSMAQVVSQTAAYEIDRYFLAVERTAQSPQLRQLLRTLVEDAEQRERLKELADPEQNRQDLPTRKELLEHPTCQALQALVENFLHDSRKPPNAASWFVCGPDGTQLAAIFADQPSNATLGKNYSWRTYYSGLPDDLNEKRETDGVSVTTYHRPLEGQRISETHLSSPFRSQATNRWKIAISTPIVDDLAEEPIYLGVVAMTIDIGQFRFLKDDTFAVLVYGNEGRQKGMILHHPIYNAYLNEHENDTRLPDSFSEKRVKPFSDAIDDYEDPFASDENGGRLYQGRWLAAHAPVNLARVRPNVAVRQRNPETEGTPDDKQAASIEQQIPTGLEVIVQERYSTAVQPVRHFADQMFRLGIFALSVVIVVVLALWYFVHRITSGAENDAKQLNAGAARATPVHEMETLAAGRRPT